MRGEWNDSTVGDVSQRVTKGTTPTTIGGRFVSAGIAFVKVESITDAGRLDKEKFAFIDNDTNQLLARSILEEDDILFTIAGTIGRVARVPRDILPANTNQAVAIVRPDSALIDPRFLYYVLRDDSKVKHAQTRVVQSVQANFSLKELSSIEVPLPPKSEQRAIAHILGTLDDKIEVNRRMNETLEAMARAIFKSWFMDFDPVRAKMEGRWRKGQSLPGLPAHFYDLFPDCLVDSDLGEIPKGWAVGTFGDVAEHPRRSISPADIEPSKPYIALEHMPRRCITLSDWGYADRLESNKFEFKRGEILFGKLRPYFHKVGIAPLDGVCSTDIVVVVPREMPWFGFVLGHVSSDAFVEYTNAGSTGTKMPRTSWAEMARYPVALPPAHIAQAFDVLIRPLVARISEAIHDFRILAALRDALLPKLISGEFRVKDAEKFVGKTV